MDNTLLLLILLSTSAFTEAHELSEGDGDSGTNDDKGDSFSHVTIGSSVGSILLIILLAWLIYYLCCRNKAPEGFTQFSNENGGNPRRRQGRWRNKHFWRRNRRQNFGQNNVDARQSSHVIIQPVVVAVRPENQNPGMPVNVGQSMPSAPPGYDESMNNMPSHFMNPPMPSNFHHPSMPSQFANPPMASNFNHPPPPMPSQFMNPPIPSNFNNPPMQGMFNNQPVSNNLNNQPQKNPNASSYYTKQ